MYVFLRGLKGNINIANTLSTFFSLAILIVSVSPFQMFFYNWIYIFLAATWSVLALIGDSQAFQSAFFGKKRLQLYSLGLLLLILTIMGHAKFPKRIIMLTFVLQMFWYYYEKPRVIRIQLFVIIAYYILIGLWSILVLLRAPDTARLLAGASYENAGFFVGGYGYTYSVVFLLPVLVFMLMDNLFLTKKTRVGIFFLIIIFSVYLILAQYLTAIILSFGIIILTLLICRSYSKQFYTALAMIVFVFFASLVFWTDNYIQMIEYLENRVPTLYMFLSKLKEILLNIKWFHSGEIIGSGGVRIGLAKNSWQSFIRSPLLGIGYVENNYELVGKHSLLIDLMAQYGIIGLLSFFLSYGLNAWNQLKLISSKKLLRLIHFSYVFFLFVNTGMELEDATLLFYIIPSMLLLREYRISMYGYEIKHSFNP